MKRIGGNSGYVGYSMSKRAVSARNEGAYPKTDFKKEYSVTASHFDYLDRASVIYVSEWHHTSKFGNKTDFYRWSENKYADIYLSSKKEISSLIKSVGKEPRMYDYLIENMQKFCYDHDKYVKRKNEVVKKIQAIFYNED